MKTALDMMFEKQAAGETSFTKSLFSGVKKLFKKAPKEGEGMWGALKSNWGKLGEEEKSAIKKLGIGAGITGALGLGAAGSAGYTMGKMSHETGLQELLNR